MDGKVLQKISKYVSNQIADYFTYSQTVRSFDEGIFAQKSVLDIAKYVLSYLGKEQTDDLFNWARGNPKPELISMVEFDEYDLKSKRRGNQNSDLV